MARATRKTTSRSKASGATNLQSLTSRAKAQFNQHSAVYSVIGTLLTILVILLIFFVYQRHYFVAGNINGSIVTSPQFYSRLVEESGEATFESLVREILVTQEAEAQGLTVTDEEMDQEIQEIEERFGGAEGLQQAIEANGTTLEKLREQLEIQLLVEKIFADKIQVSEEEIANYKKENKQLTEGLQDQEIREQLSAQKLNEEFSKWFEEKRNEANIQQYFE